MSMLKRPTIRREELRMLVPMSDSTVYRLEQRGEFPKRFNLTPRCVVWYLDEVEAWVAARQEAQNEVEKAPAPDVHQRKTRPTQKAA